MEFQVDQYTVDYLERLAYEVAGKESLIDYVLTKHQNDEDDSIVSSKPFQRLMKDYEIAHVEYETAKEQFAKQQGIVGDWSIDFATGICTVSGAAVVK